MSNVRDIEQIVPHLINILSVVELHLKCVSLLEKTFITPEIDSDLLRLVNPLSKQEMVMILVAKIKVTGEAINERLVNLERTLQSVMEVRTASDDQKN